MKRASGLTLTQAYELYRRLSTQALPVTRPSGAVLGVRRPFVSSAGTLRRRVAGDDSR
jgi:hypothetical protein